MMLICKDITVSSDRYTQNYVDTKSFLLKTTICLFFSKLEAISPQTKDITSNLKLP